MKKDIHEQITATVLASLEKLKDNPSDFKLPWHKPGGGLPSNTLTERTYRGGNALFLWFAGMQYTSQRWATFKQWQELGAQVRKGEKGSPIRVPIELKSKDTDFVENDDDNRRMMFIGRAVFNEDQIEGFVDKKAPPSIDKDTIEPRTLADVLVKDSGAVVEIGGQSAHYNFKEDKITMPDRERFTGTDTSTATEGWYATLLHELVHWSGAESRLCRTSFAPGAARSKEEYAFEELVAEFGSAFLSAETGVTPRFREDHAQYIGHWIKALKDDKKAFFKAATAAEAASEFLMAKTKVLQPVSHYINVPFDEKFAAQAVGASWDRTAKAWYVAKDSDLSKIAKWDTPPPAAEGLVTPVQEFAAFCKKQGLILPGEPVMDGQWHRTPVEGQGPGNTNGQYKGYIDGKPNGLVHNNQSSSGESKPKLWVATGFMLNTNQKETLVKQWEAREAVKSQIKDGSMTIRKKGKDAGQSIVAEFSIT